MSAFEDDQHEIEISRPEDVLPEDDSLKKEKKKRAPRKKEIDCPIRENAVLTYAKTGLLKFQSKFDAYNQRMVLAGGTQGYISYKADIVIDYVENGCLKTTSISTMSEHLRQAEKLEPIIADKYNTRLRSLHHSRPREEALVNNQEDEEEPKPLEKVPAHFNKLTNKKGLACVRMMMHAYCNSFWGESH